MVLNEVGSTIILTMFYFLPDFYCFLNMPRNVPKLFGTVNHHHISDMLTEHLQLLIRLLTENHRHQRRSAGNLQPAHLAAPGRSAEPLIPH